MASRQYSDRLAEAALRAARIAVAALAFASVMQGPVRAASSADEAVGSKDLPTVVTAKTLVADNRKKTVTYRTGVVVKRGDVTLYADEVVIQLSGKKEPAGNKPEGELLSGTGSVQTIEARGGVKIVQKDKTATAEKALYRAGDEVIVLSGSPRVWQGPNVLTGTSIKFNIQDDTIEVENANTVLYQEEGASGAPGGGPGR